MEAHACQDHASEERSGHVSAAKEQIVICGRGGPDDLRKRRSALDQLQNAILDAAQHVAKVEQRPTIPYTIQATEFIHKLTGHQWVKMPVGVD
jgi:hypothetical protein